MSALSWQELNSNKDYDYAFLEVLHYCYTMEIDGAQRAALSLALGSIARESMDYEDHTDFTYALNADPGELRLHRLLNFQDYFMDQASKRLALLAENDPYLEKRMNRYHSTRMTVRVLEGRGVNPEKAGQVRLDEVVSLIEALQENLIIQGIQRLPLARAFADAAFIYARLSGREAFSQICQHIIDEGGINLSAASSAIGSLSDRHRRLQLNAADPLMQDVLSTYGAFGTATIH